MFRFSFNIQEVRRSRHLHSRIHCLKGGQRFQVHFWRGGFLCLVGFFVFFLNCLENTHCKEQATYFTPITRRSKAFVSATGTKTRVKQKSREKIQEWHSQNWDERFSDKSMQTSLSLLISSIKFMYTKPE